ncbi:MAG: YwaF family protein, partial [Clostridia bacterium]|nr:YwaF family protein [Clostridia bacterium]
LKDCKLRRFFMTFLSTFSLLAGIAVMLYPNTVFMTYTGINVQTMVHHGLQVAFGVYLFAYNRRQIKWKSLSGGVLVFVGFLVTAMSLNLIVHNIHLAKGMTDDFNMFFISPYFGCELPILSMIRDAVPYPLFLAAYLVAFSLGALLVYVIENGISMFCSRRNAGESA